IRAYLQRHVDTQIGEAAPILPVGFCRGQMLLAFVQAAQLAEDPGRLGPDDFLELLARHPGRRCDEQTIVIDGQTDGLAARGSQHEANGLQGRVDFDPAMAGGQAGRWRDGYTWRGGEAGSGLRRPAGAFRRAREGRSAVEQRELLMRRHSAPGSRHAFPLRSRLPPRDSLRLPGDPRWGWEGRMRR